MRASFVVLSLLLCGSAFVQEAPKPAAIEGRVVNAKTGEPLRRATVTLTPLRGGMSRTGSGPRPGSAATTDAEGKFRIESLEAGLYELAAERQGYLRQNYGARRAGTTGTFLRLEAGQQLKNLDIRMTPQSVITGSVLDDEGEPLARVGIRLLREQYVEGKRRMVQVGAGSTLDTGEFRLAGVRPGRYWISATYQGSMAMGAMGAVARRSADGKPAEAYIQTYYPGVAGLSSARPLDIAAGEELRGIDIPLVKGHVYRVSGRVEGGAADLRIVLLPREGAMSGQLTSVLPDEKGAFEFANTPPGAYVVMAMSTRGNSRMVASTPVDVAGDDVGNVVLLLSGTSTVKGAIHIARDAPDKPALDRVSVNLVASWARPFGPGMSTVKQDGSFLIENVMPDQYRVMVFGLPQGYWLDSVRMGDLDVLDKGLDLASGATASLAVTLRAGTGAVSGSVTDSKQQPAAGALLILIPDPFLDGRFDLRKTINSDQTGRFNFGNVTPGRYRLYAWEEAEPEQLADPQFLKAFESKAEKIEIEPNGRHQVTVKVIPAEAVESAGVR